MRMLIKDHERLVHKYPDAVSFMKEAELRFEVYMLLRELKHLHPEIDSSRIIWIRSRLRDLRQSPIIQEPWFLDQLRHERGGATAKTLLDLLDSIP